jgi:DNA-binding MarR family transcriptional regulator
VQHAIEHGMLNEAPCATDRRIRLVSLTPQAMTLIERFLDYTCLSFNAVGKEP